MTVSTSNLVLVDTSAWICFLSCKNFLQIKECLTILLEEDRVAIVGPIYLELIQGTRNEKERQETKVRLAALHWLNIDNSHWHKAADLSFKLRRKGIIVSAIDAIISTIAIDYSCSLLHNDSDYNLIRQHSTLKLFPLT